jgi:hypothetical protein
MGLNDVGIISDGLRIVGRGARLQTGKFAPDDGHMAM